MRPVNLVIIGLTMWVFHEFLRSAGVGFEVPLYAVYSGLAALIFSTMIIAGAGNMINDYFDIKIDRVNKPESVIVGKYVKRREVILLHVILNTLAVGAGVIIWIGFGTWIPLAVHFFTTFTLWMYSVILKRKLLIGNLSIAFLTALVPLVVWWFYIDSDHRSLWMMSTWNRGGLELVKKVVYVYAGFAFLTTLIREIQKDFADVEGDRMYGCKTVPIVFGNVTGKWFVIALMVIVMVLISIILIMKPLIIQHPSAWVLLTVLLPLCLSLFMTLKAKNRKAWLLAGNLMKLTMLGGILYLGAFIYANSYF